MFFVADYDKKEFAHRDVYGLPDKSNAVFESAVKRRPTINLNAVVFFAIGRNACVENRNVKRVGGRGTNRRRNFTRTTNRDPGGQVDGGRERASFGERITCFRRGLSFEFRLVPGSSRRVVFSPLIRRGTKDYFPSEKYPFNSALPPRNILFRKSRTRSKSQ